MTSGLVRRRAVITAVIASVGCVNLALGGVRSSASERGCPGVLHTGSTTRIASPNGKPLSAYGVDPTNPKRMFVSDGGTIQRTRDGGCSWTTVYTAPALPDNLGQEHVSKLIVPSSANGRHMAYALVESVIPGNRGCVPEKAVKEVQGCAVLVSADDGRAWRNAFLPTGLGASPEGAITLDQLLVAPSDPSIVYLFVSDAQTGISGQQYVPRVGDTVGQGSLYRSTDAGRTWTHELPGGASPAAVDPSDAASLWASDGNTLSHTSDGGLTWDRVRRAPGAIASVNVAHPPAQPATITIATADGSTLQSADDGRSWVQLVGAPRGVDSVASDVLADSLAVSTDPASPAAGAPFIYAAGSGWSRIAQAFGERDASADAIYPQSFYFNAGGSQPGVVKYTRGVGSNDAGGPINIQGSAQLGEAQFSTANCPQGKGTGRAADPGPATDGLILVDNFETGCLVAFDRFGHGEVIARDYPNSEGIALTFDRQLIITTRFSHVLTETRLPQQSVTSLDVNAGDVEGPSFDRHGNLYVTDNRYNHEVIYEYPFPQHPGEKPRLVWTFGGYHFIEDTRIAPPGSPYAGDLFVEYNYRCNTTSTGTCNHDPNAIAVLHHGKRGWVRLADFAHFPSDFISLGMAFMPDGSVLVPDINGSGTILKYGPRGGVPSVFASVGTKSDNYIFAKIDISASGYVYVTSFTSATGPAAATASALPNHPVGGHLGVVRFDPSGRHLLPDFTENLTAPVGIAVPNVITGLPQLLPAASAVAAAPPPAAENPPPIEQPAADAAPAPAAMPAAAAAAAPVAQAQPQPNPVGQAQTAPQANAQPAVVLQRQTQPQLALARANHDLERALGGDSQMRALPARRNGSLPTEPIGLLAGGLMLVAALGRTRLRRQLASARVPGRTRSRG